MEQFKKKKSWAEKEEKRNAGTVENEDTSLRDYAKILRSKFFAAQKANVMFRGDTGLIRYRLI